MFEKLISWPDSKDKGIKYFSGTATYRKTINIPAERFGENRSLLLDLGSVKEIAEVRLNGQDLGILWKAPFRVDITKAAKPGDNELEVRVTNLWPNRLIGDEQYPDDCQWDGIHLKNWPEWMLKGEPRPGQGASDVHHVEALAQGLAVAALGPARAGEAADAAKSACAVAVARGLSPFSSRRKWDRPLCRDSARRRQGFTGAVSLP